MNANDAAFPTMTNESGNSFCENRIDPKEGMPFKVIHNPGMSLREYFAGQALPAVIMVPQFQTNAKIAKAACDIADALIAELNKEIKP